MTKKGHKKIEQKAETKPRMHKMLEKLKNPSQFSKPQMVIFIIAFGLIGYFLYHTFAATVVATLEGEQMTAQLAVAPGANDNISQTSPAASAKVMLAATTNTKFSNTSLPTISGSTTVGSVLTASNGSWKPTPSYFRYAWQICDSNGSNCSRSSTSVVTSNT
jgi:uncharacterized membrane protein AbrB (regulator of aidB expression)